MKKATIAFGGLMVAIIITAFALVDDRLPICHVPPGNPDNPQLISPDSNSYSGHLNHPLDFFVVSEGQCAPTTTTTTTTTTTSTIPPVTTNVSTTTTEVPSSTSTSTTVTTSPNSSTTSTVPSTESTTSTSTTISSTPQSDAQSAIIGSSEVVERQIDPETEARLRTTG